MASRHHLRGRIAGQTKTIARRALGLTLLALCAALAALFVYRQQPLAKRAAIASAALAHSAAPPSSSAAALEHGAIPDTLPDVRMPLLDGTPQSLRAYLGHPLIVNFWATWCPPCRREMPLLQQLWTRYQPRGLRIVGIAVDSANAVNQYLRQTRVGYPLMVGEDAGEAAASRFGIEPVLPFTVFADAQGRIVALKVGELHQTEADFIVASIQQVSAGRESLPEARAAIAAKMRELSDRRAVRSPETTSAGLGQAMQH